MTDVQPAPWIGAAYRHIRANARRHVLDFRFAGTSARNRWNEPDEPTLYLAGDPGVLVAEWGRHLRGSFDEAVIAGTVERDVYRLSVRLERVLDLRMPDLAHRAGLLRYPEDMLQIDRARAAARWVRTETTAQAMQVPSVAFLDDPSRWNLVVFLDRVPGDVATWITGVERIGPLRWR